VFALRRTARAVSSSVGTLGASFLERGRASLTPAGAPLKTQTRAMAGITIDTINQNVKDMQYAVRGAIVAKAGEIEADLAANPGKYPFDKIVMCNIGNPQSLGQKPITFYRQVLALCDYPEVRPATDPRTAPASPRAPRRAVARPTRGTRASARGDPPTPRARARLHASRRDPTRPFSARRELEQRLRADPGVIL